MRWIRVLVTAFFVYKYVYIHSYCLQIVLHINNGYQHMKKIIQLYSII